MPDAAFVGQLWVDTSISPPALKECSSVSPITFVLLSTSIDTTANYTWSGTHTWSGNGLTQTIAGKLVVGAPSSGVALTVNSTAPSSSTPIATFAAPAAASAVVSIAGNGGAAGTSSFNLHHNSSAVAQLINYANAAMEFYVNGTGGGTALSIAATKAATFSNTVSCTQLTSTIATGTPPLVVSSTTQVTNLNCSQLIGNTWAIPAGIGTTTPNTGAFTTLTASTSILCSGATGGIGYSTGAGGTVTQATSRTTGVTLNKSTGAITLVSAAGSATFQTFTLTNSAIAATDNVVCAQVSGTDLYHINVTNIASGSCKISFATTGGTTTEQPVFRFSVIKGVSA